MSDINQFMKSRFVTAADMMDKFNPHRVGTFGHGSTIMGADPASSGPFYLFFTRPDINIETEAAKRHIGIAPEVLPIELLRQLTGGAGMIKLLTNCAESHSFEDMILDTTPIAENWEGAKLQVPKSTLNSRQDGTIQIPFSDYAGSPVIKMHHGWVSYIEHVTRGNINPKYGSGTSPNYISLRTLDYAISIYAFQLSADGETIELGARYTGCYPTGVPLSAWQGKIGPGEKISLTIPYTFSYVEALEVSIYNEFSAVAKSSGAYIESSVLPQSNRRVFKLKFTEGIRPEFGTSGSSSTAQGTL